MSHRAFANGTHVSRVFHFIPFRHFFRLLPVSRRKRGNGGAMIMWQCITAFDYRFCTAYCTWRTCAVGITTLVNLLEAEQRCHKLQTRLSAMRYWSGNFLNGIFTFSWRKVHEEYIVNISQEMRADLHLYWISLFAKNISISTEPFCLFRVSKSARVGGFYYSIREIRIFCYKGSWVRKLFLKLYCSILRLLGLRFYLWHLLFGRFLICIFSQGIYFSHLF